MTGLASHAWVHVMGLTLLHGLWQGAVVAAVAATLMRAAGPSAAGTRHAISCAALALLVVIGGVTAIAVLPARPEEVAAVASSGEAATVLEVAESVGLAGAIRESARGAYGHVSSALPWLVAGWLAGVLVSGLRLAIGIGWIVRARRAGCPVGAAVASRARAIADRMGVGRSFHVAASSRVEVPTVVGWRRPVVLVPDTVLERWSGPELDALLAHELGHVERGDGRLALVQSVAESVLFHNPAARWLARVARAEREHRCDDVAVETCGDLSTYVRALVELESLRPVAARAGVAASGGSLLARVRRLTRPDTVAWSGTARLGAAVAALALVVGTVWIEASVVSEVVARPADRMTIAAHDPGGRFGVVSARGRVLAVGLDARSLAPTRWTQRGDSLVVHDVDGDERFAVRVLADGGLEWEPRPESWGRSGR